MKKKEISNNFRENFKRKKQKLKKRKLINSGKTSKNKRQYWLHRIWQ